MLLCVKKLRYPLFNRGECLKALIKKQLRKFGFRCLRESSLPRGLDAIVDLRELKGFGEIYTIFDVGANTGQSIDFFLEECPRAKIYSFEPVSGAYNILVNKYTRNRRVIIEKTALGKISGSIDMIVHDSVSQLNRIVRENESVGNRGFSNVKIDTLDNMMVKYSVDTIDFLKIDTEGYELYVLNGGIEAIEAGKVRAVYAECNFCKNDYGHTYFCELYEWLCCRNYNFLGLYDIHHERHNIHYCNALFVKSHQ